MSYIIDISKSYALVYCLLRDMWEVFETELSVSETVGQFLWGLPALGR